MYEDRRAEPHAVTEITVIYVIAEHHLSAARGILDHHLQPSLQIITLRGQGVALHMHRFLEMMGPERFLSSLTPRTRWQQNCHDHPHPFTSVADLLSDCPARDADTTITQDTPIPQAKTAQSREEPVF